MQDENNLYGNEAKGERLSDCKYCKDKEKCNPEKDIIPCR
jgi:hypothetical protein